MADRKTLVALAAVLVVGGVSGCSKRAQKGSDAQPAAARDATASLVDAPAEKQELPPVPRDALVNLLRLEAERDVSVPQIRSIVIDEKGALGLRLRAILALGRIGGRLAVEVLRERLADRDERVRIEAARALGIAGAEEAASDLPTAGGLMTSAAGRATVMEALGRIGDEKGLPTLVGALSDKDAQVRAAAAVALGRYGRRKRPMGEEARAALLPLARDSHPLVRYGVAFALAREHVPDAPVAATGFASDGGAEPETPGAVGVLLLLSKDPDPEIRSVAILGLAARRFTDEKHFLQALDDTDWRPRVQAVRAMSGEKSTASMRAWLASWLVAEWTSIADLEARLISPRVHPVLEGLSALAKHAGEAPVRDMFERLYLATDVSESTVRQKYTPELLRSVDTVNCLCAVGRLKEGPKAHDRTSAARAKAQAAKAPSLDDLFRCGEQSGKGLPLAERRKHLANAIREGAGTLDERLSFLQQLFQDKEASVRAAAAQAAAGIDDSRADEIVLKALEGTDALIATWAADGLGTRAAKAPVASQIVAALAARAGRENLRDIDARLTLMDALRGVKAPEAVPLLKAALADGNVTVRKAAREALKEIQGADPQLPKEHGRPVVPPVDPSIVLGRRARWTVRTTKGTFVMELSSDAAPWSVATLSTLAQRGFYDKTKWHRVVPDFVVQGGDPTGTGSGGPGYAIPAEPSALAFERGVVGIADSGPDTGGSQWFIMHSRAPHLDGRYTAIGTVTSGMDVVDALLVGDSILEIKVELVTI
ncbi:MAG: peptidylprolyl isomerase [Deltaproteobacteria bacterium]|nr:peptidylprolyl isomerase [Deltaproteobacteria bacterium]